MQDRNWVFWCLSLLLFGSLGSIWAHRLALEEVRQDLGALQEEYRTASELNRHLLDYFSQKDLAHLRLTGDDLEGVRRSIDLEGPVVLAYLSIDCPFSPLTYEALARLRSAGAQVVGIAWTGDARAMRSHLDEHHLDIPVLWDLHVDLQQWLPTFGVPFIVAIRGQRVVALHAGPVSDEHVRTLRRRLGV